MWRIDKEWKGLRTEVPWLDRPPSDIIREHFRFTLQPTDEGQDARQLVEVIKHIGSDEMLMFSTDYPHWQYDGEGPMPFDLSPELAAKILRENAERTYRFHG